MKIPLKNLTCEECRDIIPELCFECAAYKNETTKVNYFKCRQIIVAANELKEKLSPEKYEILMERVINNKLMGKE